MFLARARDEWHWSLVTQGSWETVPLPVWEDVPADDLWRRQGWLALVYNMQAWAADERLSVPPIPLAAGRHPAPHQGPRLLWLSREGEAVTVDMRGQEVGSPLPLPAGEWLSGAYDGSHLTWNPGLGVATFHYRDGSRSEWPRAHVAQVAGPLAFLVETGGGWHAYVGDLRDGSTREILPGVPGTWDLLTSLSPDERSVAVTFQASDPGPAGLSIRDRFAEAQSPTRDATRTLLLVDLATGRTRHLAGDVGKDAGRPVWAPDGEVVIVDLSIWGELAWAEGNVDRLTVNRQSVPPQLPSPRLGLAPRAATR